MAIKTRDCAKIYTVVAYKQGNIDKHSYVVGVYSDDNIAIEEAKKEEDFRGGKYECEVLKWELNQGIAGSLRKRYKIIKSLSGRRQDESAGNEGKINGK